MFKKKRGKDDEGSEGGNSRDPFFGRDPFDDFSKEFGSFRGMDEMMNDLMRNLFSSGVRIEKGKPFVYGFSMKSGSDGKPVIQEFGNVRPGIKKPMISDAREPMVDIVERDKDIIVIAELPGVNKEDIDLEATADSLEIRVETPQKKYYKKVQLPAAVIEDSTDAAYNNGVLEVKLKRKEEKSARAKKIVVK
jgi:HSP20 family protein